MGDDTDEQTLDRRHTDTADSGDRRRRDDLEADFRLRRDKVLLLVGVAGVAVVTLAAVFVDVKNEALALAALAVFGGLLGAPTALRIDERRRSGRV